MYGTDNVGPRQSKTPRPHPTPISLLSKIELCVLNQPSTPLPNIRTGKPRGIRGGGGGAGAFCGGDGAGPTPNDVNAKGDAAAASFLAAGAGLDGGGDGAEPPPNDGKEKLGLLGDEGAFAGGADALPFAAGCPPPN